MKYCVYIFSFLFLLSCSTKKNTWTTRAYHNVNSEFNVRFNAAESFKAGVKKVEAFPSPDYNELQPVFAFAYEGIPSQITSEMERTIDKCNKLVAKHSITVKPKKKGGALSQKEREFYNQREFNSVVDDAYLLSGKAGIYLQKYDQAINTFDFMLTEYPKASAIPETKIWLAIALTYATESDRVIKLLQEVGENDKLSKANKANINAAYANYYIKQGDFSQAINELDLAIKNEPKKANRIRYYFILANLSERIGNTNESAQYLQKIIKATNDYEQELSARLLLAGSANSANSQELKTNLHKMLKDPKNSDYADRIYFALAKVEKAIGNDTGAIRYLELTVEADSKNPRQTGLAYEMLGNYYYEQEQYPQAYRNLSQAVGILGAGYSRYEAIATRAASLKNLAANWQIVHREDSLQRIAKMTTAERDKFINNIIAQITEKERQEAMAQQERMLAAYRIEQERYSTTKSNNKWYFYNINSVNSGQAAFVTRWGKRRLEDNWRRKDKAQMTTLAMAEEIEEDTSVTTKAPLSNKSREYYLRDLPLTPEKMAASNNKLRPALFNLGEAYMNDVNLPQEAINTFERLIQQFPTNNEFLSTAYYYLHTLYTNSGNHSKADKYTQLLVQQYPKLSITQQLINPNYLTEQRVMEQQIDAIYGDALKAYYEGRYSDATAITAHINAQYPQNLIQPQIALLNAFCTAKTASIGTYKQALADILEHYPSSEVAAKAKELLAVLKENALKYDAPTSPITIADTTTIATPITTPSSYTFNNGKHYFALLFNNSENTDELIFTIETYNAEHFLEEDYETSINDLGNNYSILLIKTFKNLQVATNYSTKVHNDRVFYQFSPPNFRPLLITPENYDLLLLNKDVIGYIEFFNTQYQRNGILGN